MNAALATAVAVEHWLLPGGRSARLRALGPGDAAAEKAFFNGLSLGSRQQR